MVGWPGRAAVDAWAPVDVVECADPGDLARLRTVAGYDWLIFDTIWQAVAPSARPYKVFLARVHPSAVTAALRVQNELSTAGIEVLPSIVRAYSAHAVAPGEGLPITWMRDRSARQAEADYRAVFEDLLLCWPALQAAAVVGA